MKALFATVCLTALLALAARPVAANTLAFEVVVNTAPLIGNMAGPFSLDFQLNGTGPNSVAITGFNFGGGRAIGPAVSSGGASGDLGSGIALSDASFFFNELYEQFTPGNALSFLVTMTAEVTSTPDLFSFAILNGSLFNIPTTGLGDSLLLVNITKSTLALSDVQIFTGATLPGGPDYSGVTVRALPEPAALLLLGAGLVVTARFVRRKSAR